MFAFRRNHLFLLLPVLAVLAFLSGCDSGALAQKGKQRLTPDSDSGEEVARVELVPASYGTVTGKVIYDGTPPEPKVNTQAVAIACCAAKSPFDRENMDMDWIVDSQTMGVKNVVVFLQPPQGKFFKLKPGQEKPKEDVTITQPRCAFIPRVFVLFPSYYTLDSDGKKTPGLKSTNQKLNIVNDATCPHNFKTMPGEANSQRSVSNLLVPGKSESLKGFVPDPQKMTISCDIHNWMRAYGFILDHPYFGVTDDKGEFKIEGAPLGVELQVVGWHEAAGYFNGGEEGKKQKLDETQGLGTFKIKR